jgi:hypothetical protein
LPFFFVERQYAALEIDVGIGIGDFREDGPRLRDAAVVLVRHRQEVEGVRVLIAGFDGLLEEPDRLGPIGLGDGCDRDNVLHVGHIHPIRV